MTLKQTQAAARGGADAPDNDESALQEEMRREAAEGADLLGDTSTDRNLSGSSTWVTLPAGADPADAESRREPT